jgi:hypothetical protein
MKIPAIFFALTLLVHSPLFVSGFSVLLLARGGQEVHHLRLSRSRFVISQSVGGRGGWRGQEDLDNHADQMNPNSDACDDGDEGDYEHTQEDLDNHADQMNPNIDACDGGEGDYEYTQDDLDNHADQMNSNNDACDDGGEDDYEHAWDDLINHSDHQL